MCVAQGGNNSMKLAQAYAGLGAMDALPRLLLRASLGAANATCDEYHSCTACVSADESCAWCSTDSSCISSSHSQSCATEIVGTCSEAYYTIIFLVILTAMLCICCGTCYLRRTRNPDENLLGLFAPLLPQRAREYVFRNSLVGELEWMCIVCGFDNKPRNKHCTLCGTTHEFSDTYKAKRLERKRKLEEERAKRRMVLTNVVSDIHPQLREESKDDDSVGERSVLLSSTAPQPRRECAISLPDDAQISSISLSLRKFNAAPLTDDERVEAINFRRINVLTLRQKSARRRKLWQRVVDPSSGQLIWQRVATKKTIIGQSRFGYTPRASLSNQIRDSDSETSSLMPPEASGNVNYSSSPLAALLSASRSHGGVVTPTRKPVIRSGDSFDDSAFVSRSPGFTSAFDDEGDMVWQKIEAGQKVQPRYLPPKPVPSAGASVLGDDDAPPPRVEPSAAQPAGAGQASLHALHTLLSDLYDGGREAGGTRAEDEDLSVLPSDADSHDLLAVAAYTFKEKQLWFLNTTAQLVTPITQGFMRININRASILCDSFNAFMSIQAEDMAKVFKFNFLQEQGIDAGGLEREWYTLICEEIFSPQAAFFVPCGNKSSGGNNYHINPLVHLVYNPDTNPHHAHGGLPFVNQSNYLSYYHFIGRVLGKASLSQQYVSASLSLPLRKQIINIPITFSDLEFIDDELFNNLQYLKNNVNIASLSLDFSVTLGFAGKMFTCDLLPNGQDIAVTDANKDEYLQLRLKHRMLDSIKEPLKRLLQGFYEVIPLQVISVFDYMELDLLLCGIQDISLEDWLRHTEYLGDYHVRHQVIRWFWKAVESMTHEERVRLLQFTTGCARLPVQGFKALQSNDGRYRKFNIQPITKSESIYPRAHTCFNKLDLPKYDSYEELEARLSVVINSVDFLTGFTME